MPTIADPLHDVMLYGSREKLGAVGNPWVGPLAANGRLIVRTMFFYIDRKFQTSLLWIDAKIRWMMYLWCVSQEQRERDKHATINPSYRSIKQCVEQKGKPYGGKQ